MSDLFRGRRLRKSPQIREFIRETDILARHLVMPYFVVETSDATFRKPISSMPGIEQLCLQQLEQDVTQGIALGLRAVLLFGIPAQKDAQGSEAFNPNGIVQQAVRCLKTRFPDLLVITDVCLCEFTDHGHCGLLRAEDSTGEVLNDPTLALLAKIAVSHAKAGADMVAPSDMMDGRVQVIRHALDAENMHHIPILSYAVKYASAFYGPFREAAESAPQYGDRKTYQMDPANSREALREASADLDEGADLLMVKPAGPYMDIIRTIRDTFDVPVVAYQVSGEYAMLKAASHHKWIDEDQAVLESLRGLRRAGADTIITYFTIDLLRKGLVAA